MSALAELAAEAGKAADTAPGADEAKIVAAAEAQQQQAPPPAEPNQPAKPDAKPSEPPAATEKAPEQKAQSAAERAKAQMENILKPKKTEAKPADDGSEEDVEKLIKPNAKAWRIYDSKKKQWAEKETAWTSEKSKLESRIKELESKPNPTAFDESKLKAYEKQLEELRNETKTYRDRLVERDYRESPEYKQKFVAPWEDKYKQAYGLVTQLAVKDSEGNERRATTQDFDRLMATPLHLRKAAAKAMFGEDFYDSVLDFSKELTAIEKEAVRSVEEHAKTYEAKQREQAELSGKESAEFGRMRDEARTALISDYPEHFSVEHYAKEPELQEALKSGYELVDTMEAQMSQMGREDRAAAGAVIRARAAAFPLLYNKNEMLTKRVSELETELAKFRKSDPGAEQKPKGETPPEEVKGIDGLLKGAKWVD